MDAFFQTGHQKIRGIVKMETGLGFEMTMALEIITTKIPTGLARRTAEAQDLGSSVKSASLRPRLK